jgi:hypothetical protein
MNGKPKPRLKKLTAKSAIKEATALKVSSVKSATAKAGQDQRKSNYAGKQAAVSAATNDVKYFGGKERRSPKNGLSYDETREWKTQASKPQAIATKYDYEYKSTRPAQNLQGASKKLVKASKKLNQAGGRKRPK